jgi:hypothetical protein
MRMNLSVLDRFTSKCLQRDPFPHLIIQHCLVEEIFLELENTYPSDTEIIELNRWRVPEPSENQRVDISAKDFKKNGERFTSLWREFIDYHTSSEFFAEVMNLFGDDLEKYHGEKADFLKSQKNVGTRFAEDDIWPISLDCQIGINTPCSKTSSVIGPHVDFPEELYAGLLYFRRPGEIAKGGDLNLYGWNSRARRTYRGHLVHPLNQIQLFKTVRYEPNMLVLFLNTPDSVHGVSPREPSARSRRLVNIIGEVYNVYPKGLFRRDQTTSRVIRRAMKRTSRRVLGALKRLRP